MNIHESIEVQQAHDLAEKIYGLNPGGGIHGLIDSSDLTGQAFADIYLGCAVDLSPKSEEFSQLALHGEVTLYTPPVVTNGLLHELVNYELVDNGLKTSLGADMYNIFSFAGLDVDYRGYIASLLNGSRWIIAACLDPLHYDRDIDKAELEVFLDSYLLAFNGVIRALNIDYSEGDKQSDLEDEERPSILTLIAKLPIHELPDENLDVVKHGFNNFVGISSIIDELSDVVALADLSVKDRGDIDLTQAVIFYGPSGVGKTGLMRALGHELKAEIVEVPFSGVSSAYTGEWAKKIDQVFEDAYACSERILILFDEIDGMINTGNTGSTNNVTAVLKRQLERIEQFPHVFVAAATNNIDLIDPAIKADKRFPLKIPISIPVAEQRSALLCNLLAQEIAVAAPEDLSSIDDMPVMNQAGNDIDIERLTVMTDGLSQGDIVGIVNKARAARLLRSRRVALVSTNEATLEQDLAQAIERLKRSSS